MEKYFYYSPDVMDFGEEHDTLEEAIAEAEKSYEEYPGEYGIYSYDTDDFPDGCPDYDDCNYCCYIPNE